MNTPNKGDKVTILVQGYDLMQGTIERVIKLKGCGFEAVPSDNPNDWTFHVIVESNHPRNSGTFQVQIDSIIKE